MLLILMAVKMVRAYLDITLLCFTMLTAPEINQKQNTDFLLYVFDLDWYTFQCQLKYYGPFSNGPC